MATATGTETLYLYGVVGLDFTDTDVVRELDALSDAGEIEVRINTEGGSVTQGLAMYDALLRARTRGQVVTTFCDGAALSMGAVIFQAGSTRIMADNSLMMLHLPWSPNGGNAPELRKTADTLDKVAAELATIVSGRSSQPVATVSAWLDAETWFDADEAIAFGLADRRASEIAASARARAAASKILAQYRVPKRYAISTRAPIENLLKEIDSAVCSAVRTSYYGTAVEAHKRAVFASEKLMKVPGVTNADLARATESLARSKARTEQTVGWLD
jgi:ATP-dependent Clp endopeptidase proteolytic subunit ClpP